MLKCRVLRDCSPKPALCCPSGKGIFGPLAGQLTLDGHRFKRHYTFLDYLRGGLELQLMVAVDLTRSNLGQTNPKSMPFGRKGPHPSSLSFHANHLW